MGKTTMLELLEEVSNAVHDYWKEDKYGSFWLKSKDEKHLYACKITELMEKAVFGDEMDEHLKKDIASDINLSAPTFSKIINHSTDNIKLETLEKVLNPILRCLSKEGNFTDDETKRRVDELLCSIFRIKGVTKVIEHFKILPENIEDYSAQRSSMYCHELQAEYIFGNPEQTQDISYEDYFIDGEIMEDFYIGADMLFKEYSTENDSKRYVVIFDVKGIYDREYLHQRIRCLQRKDNVFAVLMVEKGECCDDENFYRDEHSNIMWIEYKKAWEEGSEICSYNYLEGTCLSWYDKKCKALMTEGIDKITGSHK